MTRIIVANRAGAVALAQARSMLSELTAEWPDINLVQRTIQVADPTDGQAELLQALMNSRINLAFASLESLPLTLPEGVVLAAVTRRVEPRSTLLARGVRELSGLPEGASVGIPAARDEGFLKSLPLTPVRLGASVNESLNRLANGELDALVLPASNLIDLDRRSMIGTLLEPEVFPPAVGQGSLGLLARSDDDLANELAYTLQHRPSADRVAAERSFQEALRQGGKDTASLPVGAFATVTNDGELTLFGALVSKDGLMLQAYTSGEAAEAADLGRELGADFLQQLSKRG